MSTATREDLEAAVVEAVIRFHQEQQGKPPKKASARIVDDIVIVRCHGVFTPTEETLVGTADGRKIVQSARREQRALTRRQIENQVARAVGCSVLRSFYDLDVRDGEQIEVYLLCENLGNRMP